MAVVERCRDEKTTFETCIKTFKSDSAHWKLFTVEHHVQYKLYALLLFGEEKFIL